MTELHDRADPKAMVAASAKRCSNTGRCGAGDALGALYFLIPDTRVEGAVRGMPRAEQTP